MRFLRSVLPGLAAFGVLAGSAFAQDFDKEELKEKILREVEKRLKAQEERLLAEFEKVIDEELAKMGEKEPKPAKARAEKKEEPKAKPESGPKKPGFLGVALEKVDKGVRVEEVVPGSAAAEAGLKKGDVVVEVNGKDVKGLEPLVEAIQSAGAGGKLELVILRDGKEKEIGVTLGVAPAAVPKAPEPVPLPKVEPEKKTEKELRERIKKFLEKEEPAPKKESKKKVDPEDELFALDDDIFEQLAEMMEQLGVDPDQFFERGDDGLWRVSPEHRQLFKTLRQFMDPAAPRKEKPEKKGKKEGAGEEPEESLVPEPPKRAYLGVHIEELGNDIRAHLDIDKGVGLLVSEVAEGSPAARAGLKEHDILLRIDGRSVRGEDSLAGFMEDAKPGQKVELTVVRKGRETKIGVELGARED